jgi:hypothetical protein
VRSLIEKRRTPDYVLSLPEAEWTAWRLDSPTSIVELVTSGCWDMQPQNRFPMELIVQLLEGLKLFFHHPTLDGK